MSMHFLAMVLSMSMTAQNTIGGYDTRVAVDRNNKYVASVWWNPGAATCYYQLGGDSNASMSWTGYNPDVDVDDNGNVVIVYSIFDASHSGYSYIYLSVNGGIPKGVYYGSNPSVTISRTTGKIAVAWSASSGGTVSGPILAATFTASPTTGPPNTATPNLAAFTANGTATGAYTNPDISSDQYGNYVITYAVATTNGYNTYGSVRAVGYPYNSVTPTFSDTSFSTTGVSQYTTCQIACWTNGDSVIAYNDGTDNPSIYSLHINATGGIVQPAWSVASSLVYNPPSSTIDGFFKNAITVACKRNTPGSYGLTWGGAQGWENGQHFYCNLMYQKVVSDAVSGSTVTLTSQSNSNYYGPNASPAIAIADSGPSNVWIDWTCQNINLGNLNFQSNFGF